MIHPEVEKLSNYPNTEGKRIAKSHYNWNNLTKWEEITKAGMVLKLAKEIDNEKDF
jgi:hypothetical protein